MLCFVAGIFPRRAAGSELYHHAFQLLNVRLEAADPVRGAGATHPAAVGAGARGIYGRSVVVADVDIAPLAGSRCRLGSSLRIRANLVCFSYGLRPRRRGPRGGLRAGLHGLRLLLSAL